MVMMRALSVWHPAESTLLKSGLTVKLKPTAALLSSGNSATSLLPLPSFHAQMRIAFLSASGQMGGAERSLYDIMASLREAEPDWDLSLIVAEDGALSAKATALGVRVKALPLPQSLARLGDAGAGGPAGRRVNRGVLILKLLFAAPGVGLYVKRLRRELREMAPDVVHANGFKMHVLGVWARPSESAAIVWHVHDYVSRRPLMARLLRRYASRCVAAVVNSRSVGEDLRSVCGAELNIHPLYNAVDLKTFAPEGERLDLDNLSGLPPAAPGTVRVGLLATMARWKGHETFLQSLSLLPDDASVRGYIIGGSIYQTNGSQFALEELRALAARLGIEDRVGFTGFVEDAAAAMRALDVVVHASTEPEPFGLVIAEGMACGRAVVVSNAGGASELFQEGKDALAHPPGDATTLARSIEQLARDPHLRRQLGRTGMMTAKRRFNRDRLASELLPIYREAIRPA
jgi:glycosyltransferase involved in cell wall biosynthesis